jgi:Rps23 Pro-64 3,4-dihydroxylase Tpa1-like proline 4-hydroxylase
LGVHLDYEKHPISGKERRINILLYLTREWKAEWGGGLKLYSANMSKCEKEIQPEFNCAAMFKTFGNSWHGFPEPITCPQGKSRKSLALYFVSDLETKKSENMYRFKAKFVKG